MCKTCSQVSFDFSALVIKYLYSFIYLKILLLLVTKIKLCLHSPQTKRKATLYGNKGEGLMIRNKIIIISSYIIIQFVPKVNYYVIRIHAHVKYCKIQNLVNNSQLQNPFIWNSVELATDYPFFFHIKNPVWNHAYLSYVIVTFDQSPNHDI